MNDGLNGLRRMFAPLTTPYRDTRALQHRPSYTFQFRGKAQTIDRKDSQRGKVYSAEREAFPARPQDYKTRRGLEGRINRLRKSATVRKIRAEFGLGWKGHIDVTLRRAGGGATSYGGHIQFSKTAMTEWILIHELAHEIAPSGVQHHWPFAYTYLKLVSRFLGVEAAARLKASFKKHGVRYKPKQVRNLTPEQKAAAAARLKAGREAKLHGTKVEQVFIDEIPEPVIVVHKPEPPLPDFIQKITHPFKI